uniref:Uncharacterized protein n=1 Tax=Caenorhabditis japonica TaxID=281687 RepID=A0A8R1EUE1_CAEJA
MEFLKYRSHVITAAPIGSMMGYVEEFKRRQTNKSCWLTNYLCGEEKPAAKSIRSRRSSRSKSCGSEARRSQRVNSCLDATPCGGSIIQA